MSFMTGLFSIDFLIFFWCVPCLEKFHFFFFFSSFFLSLLVVVGWKEMRGNLGVTRRSNPRPFLEVLVMQRRLGSFSLPLLTRRRVFFFFFFFFSCFFLGPATTTKKSIRIRIPREIYIYKARQKSDWNLSCLDGNQ